MPLLITAVMGLCSKDCSEVAIEQENTFYGRDWSEVAVEQENTFYGEDCSKEAIERCVYSVHYRS